MFNKFPLVLSDFCSILYYDIDYQTIKPYPGPRTGTSGYLWRTSCTWGAVLNRILPLLI